MTIRHLAVSLASATLMSVAFVGEARADGNKIAAEALFQEGRRLLTEGKFAEACPKFADSERLDPSASTLLNLGSCYEKAGRTASAWATYREAQSVANATHRADYFETAEHHADTLAPRLMRVTLTVPSPVTGVELQRDGEKVERAEWGVAIPVDPGMHTIVASAAGFREWKTTVETTTEGETKTVSIPALEPLPPEMMPKPAPSATNAGADAAAARSQEVSSARHAFHVAGISVGAVGIASLGAAGLFSLLAVGKNHDSASSCSGSVCTTQAGVNDRNQAVTFGNVATATVIVGGAALASGLVLWLVAPSGEHASERPTLGLIPTGTGAMLQGEW